MIPARVAVGTFGIGLIGGWLIGMGASWWFAIGFAAPVIGMVWANRRSR